VTERLHGDGFVLRRAAADDLDFMVSLATHEDVAPFMAAVSARDRDALAEEVERSLAKPGDYGRFVIEVEGDPAGVMAFEVRNRRSRIAHLHSLMLHPDFRGRRLADDAARLLARHLVFELGYHRLELECYGFNERAIRHAERSGYVREGVRRKAYWRHGEWVDGILFGLVREDLEGGDAPHAEGNGARIAPMELIHTCYRITDPDRSLAFYEALGLEKRRELPIRDEAVNYFLGIPGRDGPELELTHNFETPAGGYELGTGYGHVALTVDDLDGTLAALADKGIEPERPPYQVREGGSRICFVRDPDGYRVELIERG
jgi:lactoylglutathione lyase